VTVGDIATLIEQRDTALAHLQATQDALRAVMATLASQAGSPAEKRVWDHARALLIDGGQMAEYQRAYAEWEARRK
jgi:predicted exporter